MRKIIGPILAAGLLLSSSPASAAEGSEFGIRPERQLDWFRLSSPAGRTLHDAAVAVNKTSSTVRFRLYAVDAAITKQGDFSLLERGETSTDVGTWVRLSRTSVTLKPNTSVRIPFSIVIPRDADPGDHSGGIIVERAAGDPSTSRPQDGFQFQFRVVERVGVRIYLRVQGKVVRAIEAGALTGRPVPGGIEFSLPVRNTGTVRVEPQARLRLSGWRVPPADVEMTGIKLLLPRTEATLTAIWRSPDLAKVRATAEVTYGATEPVAATASMLLIPWGTLGFGLALLLAALWLVARIVRFVRRARRALRGETPEPMRPEPAPVAHALEAPRVPQPVLASVASELHPPSDLRPASEQVLPQAPTGASADQLWHLSVGEDTNDDPEAWVWGALRTSTPWSAGPASSGGPAPAVGAESDLGTPVSRAVSEIFGAEVAQALTEVAGAAAAAAVAAADAAQAASRAAERVADAFQRDPAPSQPGNNSPTENGRAASPG